MSDKNAREYYRRVTNILYPFSGLDKINPDIVANAAKRGTKVHKICEAIISGLGEHGIEDETWGYVESFKKWWDLGHEVTCMERRFWDDDLKITGQVDLILNTERGFSIIDLKTSSKPSKTWPVQGSAYAYLAKKSGFDIQSIGFLHLNKHGKPPKMHQYDVDDSLFLDVFRVYNHFFKED